MWRGGCPSYNRQFPWGGTTSNVYLFPQVPPHYHEAPAKLSSLLIIFLGRGCYSRVDHSAMEDRALRGGWSD